MEKKIQITAKMQLTWFVTLWILISQVSCTTSAPDPETFKRKVDGPVSEVIYAPYSDIWKAALQVMSKYPLRTYDQEVGLIETDFIRGENSWHPPYKKKVSAGGYRYKIQFKIIKNEKNEMSRIVVTKLPEIQRDFFSNPEKLSSDGLEELSLIYRLQRELEIKQLLERYKK